jgi:ankyrin repeat protein
MVAAAFGNVAVATVLIDHGADVNLHDGVHGATALHFAAMAGYRDMVTLLLAHGAAIDVRDWWGRSALHYAGLYNRGPVIADLAAKDADLDLADNGGVTAFNLASRHGRIAGARALAEAGARQGGLMEAINAGDLIRLHKLLREGADVNADTLTGTALHLAAAKGHLAIADALIAAGADLESAGDPSRAHPLHMAALVNEPRMIALLLERGADATATDGQGRTPLMVARAFHSDAAERALLGEPDRGAPVASVGLARPVPRTVPLPK